ncbi:MAG: hypothetical protein HYY12_01240 [Candidatus Methylomirabilis oxyfera]|nr:hypothetical protein [Candidatus Methylomirabilis oxyfera]
MVIRHPLRFPLMALGMVALLAALWGGLLRLGWDWPIMRPTLPVSHGPLMISGFLGTLIGLERAVALGQPWTYAGPALSGLGALALIAGVPGLAGPMFMAMGSLALVVVFAVIVRRQPGLPEITMGIGALAWLVGNGFWLSGWPVFRVVGWWAGFLVLTIAGERLELGRFLPISRAHRAAFVAAVGLFAAGLILALAAVDVGARLSGLGLLVLALWLLRYDIARRALQKGGLTRFAAVSLLSGYLWLGVAGLLGLGFGGLATGLHYDAWLHAIFLGFVFAMIFGHAPIIFPAVLGVPVSFRPTFYSHLALLHISLLLRVGGDLAAWWPGRLWGGLFNVGAVLLFLTNMALSVGRRRGLSH